MKLNAEEDSTELRQFRERWKEEVRHRQGTATTSTIQQQPDQPSASPEAHVRSHVPARIVSPAVSHQVLHTSHGQRPLSGSIARAVEIYHSAVQREQESDLDEALRLYRHAFRLNPDVDRAHFKEEERLQSLARSAAGTGHKKTISTGQGEGAATRDGHPTKAPEGKELVHTNRILSNVVENFPEMLTFEPEDEREGVSINIMPQELLLDILRNLDMTTLERFATVSRKARVLSLDSSIWRDLVHMAYKPPQIPETITLQTIVDGYDSNYRQTYIEHPRLRLDGVYIAVCHYVRRGLGENVWVNVSHLITYHRYLCVTLSTAPSMLTSLSRFFPDGQVLSLLANEDYQPALVIPILKPSLRMKGFYIGDWRLEGSNVLVTNLVERHAHTSPAHPSHHSHDPPQQSRYQFQMTLTLRSKPLGRWNKLEFVSYESVNVEDGEVVLLPLKHERPFWFSKVKSWPGY
ncbi:hypothetical protein JVU11DRAFT_6510 [Chiua virens]|nr:hypothetical protein JVU11DRAFT_6510 [Chiua virens]